MGTVNLNKGGRINLSKEAPGLKRVAVGLGWDTNSSSVSTAFDLDTSVFYSAQTAKLFLMIFSSSITT